MNKRSSVDTILHAFLKNESKEKQDRLLQFLPEKDRAFINGLPLFDETKMVQKGIDKSTLERVHWSWFLPTLKSYSPQEQALFLSAVDEVSAIALAAEIPCKLVKMDLTFIGRSYLRQVLLSSLISSDDEIIPIEYLPASNLNKILNFSKKELIVFIDLLSMYDLALEIRQIVETKILKKIYSFLRESQRRFLKIVAAKHETTTQQKSGLDRWDGTEESLHYLLHRKGLALLGRALSCQDPSLEWYVCHLLDIGRGSALFKFSEQKDNRQSIDLSVRQVEELLGYEL